MSEELDTLALSLGNSCQRRAMRLVTAESCTGGLIAATVTDIAGSSSWFDRGFIVYTPESKMELLGVQPETLNRCGVVSEPVAREMAVGALAHSNATIAVAVTGVAGPAGGTEKTPVGTVCFGFAVKTPQAVCAESSEQHFVGNRCQVREEAVKFSLKTLIALLS